MSDTIHPAFIIECSTVGREIHETQKVWLCKSYATVLSAKSNFKRACRHTARYFISICLKHICLKMSGLLQWFFHDKPLLMIGASLARDISADAVASPPLFITLRQLMQYTFCNKLRVSFCLSQTCSNFDNVIDLTNLHCRWCLACPISCRI